MTPLFGPGWGNYALEGLMEISLPQAPALWPSTPAWTVLGCMFAAMILWAALQRWRRWRRDRYRRVATASLAALRRRCEAGDATAAGELTPLLRAVALQALPRGTAASCQGARWAQTLAELAPGLPLLPLTRLHLLTYAGACATREESLALIDAVERWVEQHEGRHA